VIGGDSSLEVDPTKSIDQGKAIISLMGLKVKENGCVDTAEGEKSPLRLLRAVKRIIEANN